MESGIIKDSEKHELTMKHLRSLWILFTQAVVIIAAAVFVFSIRLDWSPSPASYSKAVNRALPSIVSLYGSGGGENSIGSGVVVSREGHILTNYHLIANVGKIEVVTPSGKSYTARLVGIEPDIDIAVLKISAGDLPPMRTAEDDNLSPGDIVLAIGNPFGLNRSTTMGIVSAVGRNHLGLHGYEHFIQTDAAINPGSSGGAPDQRQRRIGGYQQCLVLPPAGGCCRRASALPFRPGLAMRAYTDLLDSPEADNPWGVKVRPIPSRLRDEISALEEYEGSNLLVTKVWEGAAAEKLRVGDILLKVDDIQAESVVENGGLLPSSAEQLTILRAGDELIIDLSPVAGE